MRLLITGHLMGRQALMDLCDALPRLQRAHHIDATFVIADNPSITGPTPMGGSGMTVEDRDRLLAADVDLLLTGSHVWDGGHGYSTVAHPRVLRSANPADPELPGRGFITVRIADSALSVLQLTDETAPNTQATDLPTAWRAYRDKPPEIVHIVANAHGVQLFANAVDRDVALVVGSLSHIATRDLVRLPRGTVVVPDIGYVGPPGGIGGFEPDHFLGPYTGIAAKDLPPYRHVCGPTQFSGVVFDFEHSPRPRVQAMSWLLSLR